MEAIRDGIRDFIEQCLEDNRDSKVGVMAPTTKLRDQLAKQIRDAGYKVATVNHRERLSRKDAQIFAMTLHRAKGLEFDAVAVVVQSRTGRESAQAGLCRHDAREAGRKAFFVRDRAFPTAWSTWPAKGQAWPKSVDIRR